MCESGLEDECATDRVGRRCGAGVSDLNVMISPTRSALRSDVKENVVVGGQSEPVATGWTLKSSRRVADGVPSLSSQDHSACGKNAFDHGAAAHGKLRIAGALGYAG